ncbi:hypothetical protein ACJO2E_10615 [Marinobacter sp. M1N3S26]|uniref:hypothetical protein n=1 Tax=Marinobacter sp. M1N3S26 TaxID=3382299 RepID=UPI00387B6EC1
MSLLNDALKAAEQRQAKPAPSAYIGQANGTQPRRSWARSILGGIGLTVIVGLVGYAGWQFATVPNIPSAGEARGASLDQAVPAGTASISPVQPPSESATPDASGQPDRATGGTAVMVSGLEEDIGAPVAWEPKPLVPVADREDRSTESMEDSAAEPKTAGKQEPDVEPATEQAPAKEAVARTPEVTASGPREPVVSQAANEMSSEPVTASADIKQTRQTPAQRDLSASKEIRALVAGGDLNAAESILANITDTQVAPQSRYAFARSVLARGDTQRALSWVPEDLAARNPTLRLIRARAILADGDLDQAVTTLQSGVPSVADNVEYRVTLATLLQQQGQSNQAANHWAELIAWDNSRAPWWVGLAIALEGRGDVPAARRAYRQAVALPGLAPSLADYVRQRLQTLGAG